VLEPLILPKTFGLAHFGAIMGTLFMIETIGQFLVPTVGGAIYELTGEYRLLLLVNVGCLGLSMVFFTLAHLIPNPHFPSPPVRLMRPLLSMFEARPEPQHQATNGVRAVSANGAASAEPSGSPREAGTGMID
ncbi:MAG: hypothetical protein OXH38_07265, partial [Chloroflexi bacterium]|nr:hypothetical protein [Chloroflexota bacterium]